MRDELYEDKWNNQQICLVAAALAGRDNVGSDLISKSLLLKLLQGVREGLPEPIASRIIQIALNRLELNTVFQEVDDPKLPLSDNVLTILFNHIPDHSINQYGGRFSRLFEQCGGISHYQESANLFANKFPALVEHHEFLKLIDIRIKSQTHVNPAWFVHLLKTSAGNEYRVVIKTVERFILYLSEKKVKRDRIKGIIEATLKRSIDDALALSHLYFDKVPASTTKHVELYCWYLATLGRFTEAKSHYFSHIDKSSFFSTQLQKIKLVEATNHHAKIFCSFNNEIDILPSFLAYYRSLGNVLFYLVDNGSTDGTLEYLKSQADVNLFYTEESFNDSKFNATWINALISQYSSKDELIIKVDADEFLMYPDMLEKPIETYLTERSIEPIDSIFGALIDLYPKYLSDMDNKSVPEYITNTPKFFDKVDFIFPIVSPPYARLSGGIRKRVLGAALTNLTKSPIVRGGGEVIHFNANHYTSPVRMAGEVVGLAHYKIMPKYKEKLKTQLSRGEHYGGGRRERAMLKLSNVESSLVDEAALAFSHKLNLSEVVSNNEELLSLLKHFQDKSLASK
ncbi:glycosyltransferase family 2 protein [Alteromonas ponticola]|uniref:Glycosyltransferase family 2 protein n=1 Tax=Alteromonas aquimaris TaxID=2998417 RepID=A0ABT3P5L2_9ALTE|nr:glycosyltransferase family 2 protein [Alteromonas aquimaris]MCW8108063.1 glycosyltransferase family 2 protein [Alteromonas aquimaris]